MATHSFPSPPPRVEDVIRKMGIEAQDTVVLDEDSGVTIDLQNDTMLSKVKAISQTQAAAPTPVAQPSMQTNTQTTMSASYDSDQLDIPAFLRR